MPQRLTHALAGVAGGLVVLALGAVLLATGAIKAQRETSRVAQAPIATPSRGTAGGPTVNEIYKRVGAGVVFIQARIQQQTDSPFGLPQRGEGTATGSGFVLDKRGNIVTNAHVVDGAQELSVRFGQKEQPVKAKLVGKDLSTDVAVIKVDVDKSKLRPLVLGDSGSAQVGDPVVAIGNPFGFDRTVTTGIVSALQRQIEAPNKFTISNVIQTDASINPGNSGGPLLDARGRVIGINSQIATPGQGSIGIGFAIPIDTVKRDIPQLERRGRVDYAFLGITTSPVTRQIADDLNLARDSGALVQDVVKGGPADRAGLRAGHTPVGEQIVAGGDLIVEVDSKQVRAPDDIAAAIADNKPGDQVQVVFYRGNARRTTKVRLGKRPAALDGSGGRQPPGGTIPLP